MPLFAMRRIYLTNVRPILTYACAIWFLRARGIIGRLSNWLVDKLESVQYQFLMKIAGAFKQTPREYLLKELNIEALETHFYRCAAATRAQALDPNPWEWPSSKRTFPTYSMRASKPKEMERHPYYVHDCEAKDVQIEAYNRLLERNVAMKQTNSVVRKDWENQKDRARVINLTVKSMAQKAANDRWQRWRTMRLMDSSKNAPALWDEEWGRKSLNLYRHLPRALSSILVQCRTGCLGLRTQLYRMKVGL